jgi:hypothetical protein
MAFSLRQLVLVLVLVVTFVLADSVSFTFDNVDTYQPQASIAWTPSQVLNGDLDECENDPAPKSCEGFWWEETEVKGALNGTLQVAFGPTATMNFTFIGDSVQVWGVKYNAGANATYTLDGGALSTFSTFADSDEPLFQQQLLSLPNLTPATHSLIISYDSASFGAADDDRKWLNIDYFMYTTPSSLLEADVLAVKTVAITSGSQNHTSKAHASKFHAKSHTIKSHASKSHNHKSEPTKLIVAPHRTISIHTVQPTPSSDVSSKMEMANSSISPPPASLNTAALAVGLIVGLVFLFVMLLLVLLLCRQRRITRALSDKLGPVEAFAAESSQPSPVTYQASNPAPTYDGASQLGEEDSPIDGPIVRHNSVDGGSGGGMPSWRRPRSFLPSYYQATMSSLSPLSILPPLPNDEKTRSDSPTRPMEEKQAAAGPSLILVNR